MMIEINRPLNGNSNTVCISYKPTDRETLHFINVEIKLMFRRESSRTLRLNGITKELLTWFYLRDKNYPSDKYKS